MSHNDIKKLLTTPGLQAIGSGLVDVEAGMTLNDLQAILESVKPDPASGHIMLNSIPMPYRAQFAQDSWGSTYSCVADAEGILRFAHYVCDWEIWKSIRLRKGIVWQPRFTVAQGGWNYSDKALDDIEREQTAHIQRERDAYQAVQDVATITRLIEPEDKKGWGK